MKRIETMTTTTFELFPDERRAKLREMMQRGRRDLPCMNAIKLARWSIEKREKETAVLCLDCGIDTFRDEFYIVDDALWLDANPAGAGMLCVGCHERRLGRELTPDDFTDCPANRDPEYLELMSARLLERLGASTDGLHTIEVVT
jgi:hypothetical protein